MARKKKEYKLATFDIETDPFKKGRVPEPFCCGLYLIETNEYMQWWGKNCLYQFIEYLKECPHNLIIYAHNGGKFDFYYF